MSPTASSSITDRRVPQQIHPSFANHVLTLTVSRPPVNAYNGALWRELRAAFDGLGSRRGEDGDVRAVVLVGEGRGFTAGLDLVDPETTALGKPAGDVARTALDLREHILDFQDAISSIERCPVPVIAAVHGLCIGLGCDIIATCDVRLCAADVKFSIREVAIGMAADIGVLQRLPKLVANDSLLRELALTGRFFGADEADRLGLISRVVSGGKEEVLEAAQGVATEIAKLSPVAASGTKHLLNHARNHTVAEGLEYTALWNASMLQTRDLTDAIAAVSQKGAKPEFRPLREAKL